MALFDLSLKELKSYCPDRDEQADFDAFWMATLQEARAFPLDATFEKVDYGLVAQETFDVTFRGFGGQAVRGWLILPRQREGKLPCVVEFIGYGGGRSFAFDWLLWASAGYAHFVMDTRGQGSSWSAGDTPDLYADGGNAHYPGSMTRGILDPQHYYYRSVFTDAVRAIEAASSHPRVNPSQVAVTGGSQGVNFATRAKAKALFSVGLMDQTCPPSTVYAAYNYWVGEKEIKVYPYNDHEGGGSYQTVEKLKFLKRIWK